MSKNKKHGLLFILSAPAGTGKTTLVRMLTKDLPKVKQSISFTTRKARAQEKDGVHYHFISKEEFEEQIKANKFLEHVKLYGDLYGTSLEWVEAERNKGHHVILVIDTQGALQLKGKTDAIFIFIEPPSLDVLRKRLEARRTESKEKLNERLAWSKHELEAIKEYDYSVVNDDLLTAYKALVSIIVAEEHRVRKQEKFKSEV